MNLNAHPRLALTSGPSPIHRLDRLGAHLGGRVQLYAKREDRPGCSELGGHTTRKLEYLVPAALQDGCDTLVAEEVTGSAPARQVLAVAARLGLACVLVAPKAGAAGDAHFRDALEAVRARGGNPFGMRAGCADHPLGALGHVGFADEVRRQEREQGVRFDCIVTSAVTGCAQAGMLVGFAHDQRTDQVVGIDASTRPRRTFDRILRMARLTAERLGLDRDIGPDDVVLDRRFSKPASGLPDPGAHAADLVARLEGLHLDPARDGWSVHGLIEKVLGGEFPDGAHVLFVCDGSAPRGACRGLPADR